MKTSVPNEQMMSLIKDAISRGQKATLKVAGTSMMPFFKDGLTEVTLAPAKDLQRLDVVLFQIQDKYYLHRIINMDGIRVTAQGDHLFSKEEIDQTHIIARVTSFSEGGRLVDSRDIHYLRRVKRWHLIKPFILRLRRRR